MGLFMHLLFLVMLASVIGYICVVFIDMVRKKRLMYRLLDIVSI